MRARFSARWPRARLTRAHSVPPPYPDPSFADLVSTLTAAAALGCLPEIAFAQQALALTWPATLPPLDSDADAPRDMHAAAALASAALAARLSPLAKRALYELLRNPEFWDAAAARAPGAPPPLGLPQHALDRLHAGTEVRQILTPGARPADRMTKAPDRHTVKGLRARGGG